MVPRTPRYIAYTLEIMERLAAGGVPEWELVWVRENDGRFRGGGLPLRPDDTAFQGESLDRLRAAGRREGNRHPYWLTAVEGRGLGGSLKHLASGATVRWAVADDGSIIDAGVENNHGHLRYEEHTVFNADQFEGLPARYTRWPWELWPVHRDKPIPAVDAFIGALGVDVRPVIALRGDPLPGFQEKSDRIGLAPWQLFHGAVSFYRAVCHEVMHWSRHVRHHAFDGRHTQRDREAWEELVADFGAAFLMRDLLGPQVGIDSQVAYLNRWVVEIPDDAPRVLAAAAGAAEACVDWLHAKAPGHRIEEEAGGERLSVPAATRDARDFVALAERLRGADYWGNPALIRDGLRLLGAGARIVTGHAEVRDALLAAAAIATPGTLQRPVSAEAYLEVARSDAMRGMEQAVDSVHRKWNDGRTGRIRL